MDETVLWQLSYGMYAIGAKHGAEDKGCIVNTIVQITAENPIIAVSMNKDNYTYEVIRESGEFAVSILGEEVDVEVRTIHFKPPDVRLGDAEVGDHPLVEVDEDAAAARRREKRNRHVGRRRIVVTVRRVERHALTALVEAVESFAQPVDRLAVKEFTRQHGLVSRRRHPHLLGHKPARDGPDVEPPRLVDRHGRSVRRTADPQPVPLRQTESPRRRRQLFVHERRELLHRPRVGEGAVSRRRLQPPAGRRPRPGETAADTV